MLRGIFFISIFLVATHGLADQASQRITAHVACLCLPSDRGDYRLLNPGVVTLFGGKGEIARSPTGLNNLLGPYEIPIDSFSSTEEARDLADKINGGQQKQKCQGIPLSRKGGAEPFAKEFRLLPREGLEELRQFDATVWGSKGKVYFEVVDAKKAVARGGEAANCRPITFANGVPVSTEPRDPTGTIAARPQPGELFIAPFSGVDATKGPHF